MDFQPLIEDLSQLFNQSRTGLDHSGSTDFQSLREQTEGATTPAVIQVLNAAIAHMPEDEVYCEVGCLWGANLIGALRGNPERMTYAVESPRRLGAEGEVSDRLLENLIQSNLQDQVYFCAQETEDFFADLGGSGLDDRIGVFFDNGASNYRSLLMSLLLAQPFLAEKALIILGNAELGMVRQAAWDFGSTFAQARVLLDLSKQGGYSGFGQGLLLLGWDTTESTNPKLPQPRERMAELLEGLELHWQATNLAKLKQDASQCVADGRLEDAAEKYQTVLLYQPANAEIWQNLGMVHYLTGEREKALEALATAIQFNPQQAVSFQIMGLVLEQQGHLPEAAEAYRRSISLNPSYTDALNNLGELLVKQDELTEAESLFRQAIAGAPEQVTGHINLGAVLAAKQQWEEAIAAYQQAIAIKPQNPYLWQKVGEVYSALNKPVRATLCEVYALYFQNQHEKAIQLFQTHLTLAQLETYDDCLILYDCFSQCGYTEQVIKCALATAQIRPGDEFLQILPDLVLPKLYQSAKEMREYRQRYQAAYTQLLEKVQQADLQSKPINLQAIENFTNFYLSFQAENDRPILEIYGKLLHRLITERHPNLHYPTSDTPPPTPRSRRIRIGYIAESLGNNSETRWALGWLKHHDRAQFEIYCYSIDAGVDLRAEQFRLLSDTFRQLPNNLEVIGQQILADQLDVLVYLSIGLRTKILTIASLRLAPVQCSAWGHPVTSGLPTIDYYLSSELMEPPNGQEHYTEQLVRLPNIGFCYPNPQFPEPSKTRTDFGFREDAVIYLSCQLVFKYLPQHDYLFAEIARQVPDAQIVFVLRSTQLGGVNPNIERQFKRRLQRAFEAVGLRMEDYCVFLPGQDLQGYVSLLSCADVFLDTLGFSGGYTTLDAISHNLPVVCCTGKLMRGRQSTGILNLLSVTETIADTEAEYIRIAVRLGLETDWRRAIVQQIDKNHSNLFEDTACVAGLEQFYRQVTQLSMQESTSI